MCQHLITLDGTELWSVGDLVDEGILPEGSVDPGGCLCGVPLGDWLAASGRMWLNSNGIAEWEETDAEGRTYWKDGLIEDPERSKPPEDGLCGVTFLMGNPEYPYRKGAT